MKKLNKIFISLIVISGFLFGCTEQFEEFKNDNENLTKEDISARFFFPSTIHSLHSPGAWNYWFGKILARDVYGAYSSFGYKNSWEFPDVVFNTNRSWFAGSDAWNKWSGYFLTVDGFLKLVEPGGSLENPLMEAVGRIIKANYFHMYTEQWGELPYTEVGTGTLEPKFDEQKVIYKGIIDELNTAMEMIGNETATGIGANDLAEYDILFGGDLQKWKSFANGLKLRVALRANGAPGEDFADAAISSALANPLPSESVQFEKDLDAYWGVAAREGDFYSMYTGSWKMLSDKLVNTLQNNNDPRLEAYADPIPGGELVFGAYTVPENKELVDYLLANTLEQVGVPYTSSMEGDDLVIEVDDSKDYYVGMPMRFVDGMKTFLHKELFSMSDMLTHGSRVLGKEIPQVIMPLAEVYFMQAEAAVLGFGGDANELYRMGIEASFEQWDVQDNGYLDSPIANLSGTKEEKLQQIGLQSWLAAYFVDINGWAIARDFHLDYITDPTPDLPNIFSIGIPLGTSFPQRIVYAQKAYDLNGDNLREALSRQGPDNGATELWFTKGEK